MGLGWRPTTPCFHFNITPLNTAMSSDLRQQNLKHPVEGVVWAFLSSGACDSFHGFSPITFLEALTESFHRDILQEDENGCLQPACSTHTAFIKSSILPEKIRVRLPSGKHHFIQTQKSGRTTTGISLKRTSSTQARGKET